MFIYHSKWIGSISYLYIVLSRSIFELRFLAGFWPILYVCVLVNCIFLALRETAKCYVCCNFSGKAVGDGLNLSEGGQRVSYVSIVTIYCYFRIKHLQESVSSWRFQLATPVLLLFASTAP